ncbi:MAG: hypothetical protein WDZ77_00035 [Candidatus Pacearchaeota archaeon]
MDEFRDGILEVRKGKLQYLEHVFEDNQLKFSLIGIEGIRAVGIEERWNPQISDCSNKDFQEAYGNIPSNLLNKKVRLYQVRRGNDLFQILKQDKIFGRDKEIFSVRQKDYFSNQSQ